MTSPGDFPISSVPKLGFYNCKGGTGKSTIAAQSAMKMAEGGLNVGLIDMDFSSPDLQYILGMNHTYRDVADAMDWKNIYPFTHPEIPSLHVFSMGFMVRDGLAVLLDEERILDAVHQLFSVVKWPQLDIFILDMPPQTSRLNVKISKEVMNNPKRDAICIVTTPRQESIMDALRALDMLKYFKVTVAGMVVNMAFWECGACNSKEWNGTSLGEIEKELQIPVLSVVPFTTNIRDYLNTENMLKKVSDFHAGYED